MPNYTETELKLKMINPESGPQIMNWPFFRELAGEGAWRRENLEARYYDTEEHDLQKARFAYRIRQEGGKWVAAVKGSGTSAGGLHRRQEWEAFISEPAAGIEPFLELPVGEELAKLVGDKPLLPLFITLFERHTLTVSPSEGTTIEVAIDQGSVFTEEVREPIQEVELELKEGSVAELLSFAASLAAEFPFLIETRSKYARGLNLAGLAKPEKNKERLVLDASDAVRGQSRLILLAAVSAVLNAQGLLMEAPEEREQLHQFRITLRRMRSLLAFFRPLLAEAQAGVYEAELRQFGQAMGLLRETDVLWESWQEFVGAGQVRLSSPSWLEQVLAEQRSQQFEPIRQELVNGSGTALFLRIWSWLEQDDCWREGPDFSLKDFADARLADWLAGLLEYEKTLDFTNVQKVHELRIGIKKLRYVLEALVPALGSTAEEQAGKMKKLQDALGDWRDTRLTEELTGKLLVGKSSRALQREAGMLIGWQAREIVCRQNEAERRWRKTRRYLTKLLKAYAG